MTLPRQTLVYLLIALLGCVEPYEPVLNENDKNLLVIEGYYNTTDHVVDVNVSNGIKLDTFQLSIPVLDAVVQLSDNEGTVYTLNNTGKGAYSLANVTPTVSAQYKLQVTTANGQIFQSDFVEQRHTAPIDSISWKIENSNLIVSANTHDPESRTHYYFWEFDETWEHSSSFNSYFILDNGVVIRRPPEKDISLCWTTVHPTKILIANSLRLSEDRIFDFPLSIIPGNSEKISRRYTIEVRQKALSQQGFDFWKQVESTNENIGGLFDKLPSKIEGNIRTTDESTLVLGQFECGEVSRKRIFILPGDLPESFQALRPDPLCRFGQDNFTIPMDLIPSLPDGILFIEFDSTVPGYITARPVCIDCRVLGGTTTRPDFW